jgi:hypothetical protein
MNLVFFGLELCNIRNFVVLRTLSVRMFVIRNFWSGTQCLRNVVPVPQIHPDPGDQELTNPIRNLAFSSSSKMSYFSIFLGHCFVIFWERISLGLHSVEIATGPGQQVLDSDIYSAKWCRSDGIRSTILVKTSGCCIRIFRKVCCRAFLRGDKVFFSELWSALVPSLIRTCIWKLWIHITASLISLLLFWSFLFWSGVEGKFPTLWNLALFLTLYIHKVQRNCGSMRWQLFLLGTSHGVGKLSSLFLNKFL